jgi:hypothetical protein
MSDKFDVWKRFSEDRRQQSALAFYEDAGLKEFHRVADNFIAGSKHFRPQFVKKLPVAKRAQYLAQMQLPQDLASQLVVSYHFSKQRPMMQQFLDALNIPNDAGLIKEDHDPGTPDSGLLEAAVAKINASYSSEDVFLYLAALYSQNQEVWGGLKAMLEKLSPTA